MFQPHASAATLPSNQRAHATGAQASLWPIAQYVLLATLWISGFAFVAAALPGWNELWFLLASMVLATPVALRMAYGRALARIDTLRKLEPTSALRKRLSGGVLRVPFWLLPSTFVTGSLLLQLATDDRLLGWLFAAVPLVRLVQAVSGRLLRGHVRSLWRGAAASRSSALISAGLLTMGVVLWTGFCPPEANFKSLVEARAAMPASTSGSALMDTLFLLSGAATAFKQYGLSLVAAAAPALRDWLALSAVLLFPTLLAVALGLSLFQLPAREVARAVLPAREDTPQIKEEWQGACVALLLVLLLGLVAAVGTSSLERRAARMDWPGATRACLNTVEQIDGYLYPRGTVEELAAKEADVRERIARADAVAETLVRRSFDQMRANVDPYLDWHYSLAGEAARVGAALARTAADQATQRLAAGVNRQALDRALGAAVAARAQAARESEAARAWLAERRLRIDNPSLVHVGVETALSDVAPTLASPPDPIAFKQRLAGSLGAGMVAGAVVRGVVVRAAGRAIAARAGGTAAGAALGSVIPGLGTAIGAVAGLGVGIAVDWVALKLNEAATREQFRADLMAEIDAQERKALALLSAGKAPGEG